MELSPFYISGLGAERVVAGPVRIRITPFPPCPWLQANLLNYMLIITRQHADLADHFTDFVFGIFPLVLEDDRLGQPGAAFEFSAFIMCQFHNGGRYSKEIEYS